MFFLYAVVWSFGAVLDDAGKKSFSQFLRKSTSDAFRIPSRNNKMFKIEKSSQIPESVNNVHNYFIEHHRWRLWKELLDKMDKEIQFDHSLQFHEIVVPTTETLHYSFLLNLMVKNEIPTVFVGPTGTGKTVYISKYIRSLSIEEYVSIFACFSAKTSANQVQDIIDHKMEKRGRRLFGPPFGKKCIVFVDDLNMPQIEETGAQPPIELLRQFMDHKGWYDRKEKNFREL